MDYKQKYKEALERAKSKIWNDKGHVLYEDDIIEIFPKLAESEDERIRKEIISIVKSYRENCITEGNHRFDDCISWLEKQKTTEEALQYLKENHSPSEVSDFQAAMNIAVAKAYNKGYADGLEKQGEQKPVDKVETIYKIGDFVHCTTINGFEYTYIYKSNHGEVIHAFVNYSCGTHGVVSIDDTLFEPSIFTKRKATTEEIVTLLQSIHKNGFIWDAEKKELKKIEQNPFDYENANIPQKDFAPKAEPKFKVGDWVVDNRCGEVRQVVFLEDDGYEFPSGGWVSYEDANKHFHLWTIEDAKDGDVLYCKNNGIEYIVMNKGINESGNIDSYFRYNSLGGFGIDIPSVLSVKYDSITPATKEQRDKLEKAMLKAGYTWNTEKKELIKNM